MSVKWTGERKLATIMVAIAMGTFIVTRMISSHSATRRGDEARMGISPSTRAQEQKPAVSQSIFRGESLGILLMLAAFFLMSREINVGARLGSELADSVEVLRHKIEIMQSILSNMADGVIIADQNGKFLNWNSAAEQMGAVDVPFGLFTERGGISSPDTAPPYPAYQVPLARAVRGEDVTTREIFMRNDLHPGGAWVNVSGRPLRNLEGQVCGGVVILRDRTQVRRAEEEISRLQQALERHLAASDRPHKDRRAA